MLKDQKDDLTYNKSLLKSSNAEIQSVYKIYSNCFYVDCPTGSTKAVSHIEGASPWVTGLNLDLWTSR